MVCSSSHPAILSAQSPNQLNSYIMLYAVVLGLMYQGLKGPNVPPLELKPTSPKTPSIRRIRLFEILPRVIISTG